MIQLRPLTLFITLTAFMLMALTSLQLGDELSFIQQWSLLKGAEPQTFADFNFVYAQLPRLVMAIIIGTVLGLVGSLMQQLTQNSLTSPLTLGTFSGAWLALIIANVWFPELAKDHMAFIAMIGAMFSICLVITIVGPQNITGLPLILSGMVINILFGAIATSIILLNDQYAKNVFIWGAGDLAQNGWDNVHWLLPRLSVTLILLFIAPRILSLMRLGHQGAAARGLNVIPYFIILIVLGLWLVSVSIATIGVISFIGLLSPNIARAIGARTAKAELYVSMLIGSMALMLTDIVGLFISQFTLEMIPSGTTAATIGAPALIWFSRKTLKAQDQLSIKLPQRKTQLSSWSIPILITATFCMLFVSATVAMSDHGLQWALPDVFNWALRWPRFMTALAAGMALATAGTVLQRLIYNPLASPDILGISAGATFALVGTSVFLSTAVFASGSMVAFSGSMMVLILLVVLGRKNQFAPSSMVLMGIAITALIESLVQFALAKGTQGSYTLINWLAGSTYRVVAADALILSIAVMTLIMGLILLSRWLTLISAGRAFATARGLNVQTASVILLCSVALLCALVTTTMGPVAFVGLLAPHMAVMIGARQARDQLIVAALAGGLLMLLADWIGQTILFPMQIAAGTIVSVVGGSYFLLLLIRGQKK